MTSILFYEPFNVSTKSFSSRESIIKDKDTDSIHHAYSTNSKYTCRHTNTYTHKEREAQ